MNLRLELESVTDLIESEEKPCSEIVCLLRNVLKNYDEENEIGNEFKPVNRVNGSGTG